MSVNLLRLCRLSFVQFSKSSKRAQKDSTLSQEEIDKILYRNVKLDTQTNQQQAQQRVDPTNYEKDINSILTQIQVARNKREESEKQRNSTQEDQETQKQEIIITEDEQEQVQKKIRFKYGLPIPNKKPELEGGNYYIDRDKKPPTPTMNLFEVLELNKDFTVEEYENTVADFLKVEDMYGKKIHHPHKELQRQMILLENNGVPMDKIKDEKYMNEIRECFQINMSLPGCIENEDPHRFLKNIRPIEEFRHTPLIPISEKQMREFNEKVEAYHRKAKFLEVKKETLYQLMFGMLIFTIILQMLKIALKKEEQYGVAFQRLKNKRKGQATL